MKNNSRSFNSLILNIIISSISHAVHRLSFSKGYSEYDLVGKARGRLARRRQKTRVNAYFVRTIGMDEPHGSIPNLDLHGGPAGGGVDSIFAQRDNGVDLALHGDLGVSFAFRLAFARREKMKGQNTQQTQ
jgi:hypothetical protein